MAIRESPFKELAGFVATAVDGYVREHRGRVQNPNLVWCGEDQDNDFELCVKSNYTTTAASSYQPNSRIKRLSEAWTGFDNWNEQNAQLCKLATCHRAAS